MLQEKFIIPLVLKEYCTKSTGLKENSHRYWLNKKYCDPYESTKEIFKNVPPVRISEKVWRESVLSRTTTEFLLRKKFTYYIIKFLECLLACNVDLYMLFSIGF